MTAFVGSQFCWDGYSLNYSPPEPLKCAPTTPASDIYSFAATYMLLRGTPPEHAGRRLEMELLGRPETLKDLRRGLPGIDETSRGRSWRR